MIIAKVSNLETLFKEYIMKQLVLVFILSLLIIGSTTFALAQSQSKYENLTYNWNASESQQLGYFLELGTYQYDEAGEHIVDMELTGKRYSHISTGNDLAMNQQQAQGVRANFERKASEVIEIIKEAMEVTKTAQAWTKKLQVRKIRVGSEYELYIRTDLNYGKNGPTGLIELELMKIMW